MAGSRLQGAALAVAAILLAAAPPPAEAALGQRVVCYIPDWAVVSQGFCAPVCIQVGGV